MFKEIMSSSYLSVIITHGRRKALDTNLVSISVEYIKGCKETVFIPAKALGD